MKSVRRTDSASQSCSCTSCLYKSESEQPSIRKYIARGSRISRLYFGQYIPLRERKLLNRLVRTRAVYDDLRARLISDSTLSLDKNADLRPRKHHHAIKPINDKAKSGAILEIIDIIDKGGVTDPKKLSECCSCCSCSSQAKILGSDKKEQGHKRTYNRRFERQYGPRTQYSQRVLGKTGERYNKRGVRFKAKRIRSEPCTCTFKFSGLIKNHSKTMVRKVRPVPIEPIPTMDKLYVIEDTNLHKLAKKSYHKVKDLQGKLEQDMKKLNETAANVKQNLQLQTKRSLEKVKQTKDKLKANVESGVRKSLQAVKAYKKKDEGFEYHEYPEEETNFKIKKDSIIKFRDYLKRKELMKDWECDLECIPDTCEPKECFKILKLKRLHKRNRPRDRKHAVKYEKFNREVNIGEKPLKKTSSSVQSEEFSITTATHMKKQKPILRDESGKKIMGKRLVIETKEVKKEMKQGFKRSDKEKANLKQKVEKSDESTSIAGSREEHGTQRQYGIQGRESKLGLGMELKTKPHKHKFTGKRKAQGHHKGSQIALKPLLEPPPHELKKIKKHPEVHDAKFIQTNKHGKKIDTSAPSIPTAHKNIAMEVKQKERAHQIADQNLTSPTPRKQAVRIESKFSFSVEFYKKDKDQNEVEPAPIKEKKKHTGSITSYASPATRISVRKKNKRIPLKVLKNKGSLAKAKYIQAKATLVKCMCRLKSTKFKGTIKRMKTSSIGTVTSIVTKTEMIDKHVETKKRDRIELSKVYQLQPYECEPGICIPGECNPLYCKKLLDQRNKLKTHNKGSYTRSRQTKSASSVVPVHFGPIITKNVQSTVVSTRPGQTSTPRRYKEGFSLDRYKENDTSKAPGRQAVRIGSSFSFNIEFYKEKQVPITETEVYITNEPAIVRNKKKNFKERGYQEYNRANKSMFAHVTNMNKNIGPSLKRCFCTLKLYKNKNTKKKELRRGMLTTHTQTFGELQVIETVGRKEVGTKTKWRRNNELLPYECEPYFCVPGECDPYTCLERIKNRERNVRDYGVFTDKAKMTSISSITENTTRSTAVLVQPKLYRKGTYINDNYKYNKASGRTPREAIAYKGGSGETYDSVNSKQAVRIGSSFNFSIEFSKQLPQTLILTKQPKRENIYKIDKKNHRDKGIRVAKMRIDNADIYTQSLEPRKVHRSSLVRPMLKRCFCTLNLQKRTKQQYHKGRSQWTPDNQHFAPKMYTVSRAMTTRTGIISHHNFGSKDATLQLIGSNKMISISTSSFLFKKYTTTSVSKYNTLKLCPVPELPMNFKQPIKINSNLSVEIEFIREFNLKKELRSDEKNITQRLKSFSYGYVNETPQERINVLRQPSLLLNNPNNITGISQYLERCFYAMNVQISHAKIANQKKKYNYNLKPYECEPGICVPGECDPYECQKAINRRLMRNVHRGSSTQSVNKSISSYTTQTGSGSRSTQLRRQVRSHSQESKPKKYKIRNQRDIKHGQAVRVGSSFSFDIEFSKKSPQSPVKEHRQYERGTYHKKPLKRTYSTRSTGAQGRKVRYGKDRQLQSTASSAQKASNYAPRMKRCFCTLKLQKKGKMYRENAKLKAKMLNVSPKINTPSITSRSMKVGTGNKYRVPKQHIYNLKPYECEPGVCIPGQCNPHECLERIKNRTDFGVGTTPYGEKSISSMTSEGRQIKRKLQTHGIDVRHKKIHKRDVKRSKDINSISSGVSGGRGSRQAVRIGSSFSFNVEFYKDKPGATEIKEISNEDKSPRVYAHHAKERRPKQHVKGSFSQSSRDVFHRNTQIGTPTNQMGTMTTSFLKRCFCTAKLQGIKIPEQHNTSTFMQKCFCVLGLRNKQKKYHQPPKIQFETADKRTNTNFRQKMHVPPLEPYECEPGICIPGQCDPYVCDKYIQQRLAKQYSRSSATESVKTQSVSSNFGYGKRLKDGTTQARHKKYKQNQYVHRERSISKSDKNKLDRQYTNNTNKRLVRIGSNFSFNIEFYKDNADSTGRYGNFVSSKEKIRETKTYPNAIPHRAKAKIKHMKGTTSMGPSIRSNESQTDKQQMKTFGVNPLLKRCFCTLKLLKKPIDQAQNINKKDVVTMKSVETQSHKMFYDKLKPNDFRGKALLPYECEPYVCTPGECNPVECLERIKRRNQYTKDFGTYTEYPGRKSVGSVATTTTKNEHLQSKYRATRPKTTQKTYVEKSRPLVASSDRSRQAVRIGSNFSFNIEFFKSNGNDEPEIIKSPTQEYSHVRQYVKRPQKYQTKSQTSYVGRSVDSQVATKMRSAETGIPNLKRCFCTLQLKNKGKNENKLIKPKSEHSAVGAFLKKCICVLKINKAGKLQQMPPKPTVKYEIKGTSTYSQSPRPDQIIKPIRILEPYECEPNVCIPGECDPYECLKRIQKRQVRDFGTGYKRNVRHFATNSMKEPLTRNTEAQYHRKQRSHSQGTSLPANQRRPSHETSSYTPHHYKGGSTNRQAVRIGSNFSFNVEFFKEKGDQPHNSYKGIKIKKEEMKAKKVPKIKTRSEKLRARSRGSNSIGRNTLCQFSQCSIRKGQYTSSGANTIPKRCFCTLKLLNNQKKFKSELKPLPPKPILTEDKMTATKLKYTTTHELGVYECPPLMCIPGECDPYDCLEKLKRGERKYRNVGTRAGRTSVASVGNTSKLKTRGSQFISKKRNFNTYTPRSEPQSVILKSPQMDQNMDKQNKRAVRIGSNFNFSIDFFKEKSQPAVIRSPKIVREKYKDEDSKSYSSKNVAANAGKFRHHDSQADATITRDQASDAGNMLKRCFCTLQLQKSSRQRNMLHNNMVSPGINVKYPQIVTVGRVSVEPFNKKILKTQGVGNKNQSSQVRRSKTTDPKMKNELRNVATKTDKKHLQKKLFQSLCDPSSCPDYKKKGPLKNGIRNDMQTILPYTPSKFNKQKSKTLVSTKDKLQKICDQNQIKIEPANPRDTLVYHKGKRLTAKKSKKSIPRHLLDTKSNLNNSIFCRCARLFSKRNRQALNDHDNQESIDKSQNGYFKVLKDNKLTKNNNDECPVECLKNIGDSRKSYSKSQSGHAETNIMKPENMERSKSSKSQKMKVTFADNTKYSPSMIKEKRKKFLHHGSSKGSKLCYSCSADKCPIQCYNLKNDKKKPGVFNMLTNCLTKNHNKPIIYSESADNCHFCERCQKKIETDEISKGAGDREFTEKSEKKSLTNKSERKSLSERSERKTQKIEHSNDTAKRKKRPCPCGKRRDLFVMQVDSVNYDIVNKKELFQKVRSDKEQLQYPIPTSNAPGAKISIPAKGNPKITGAPGKTLRPKTIGPCVCGSIKCAIESKRVKSKSAGPEGVKPCVCGAPICAKETRRLKKLREQYVCTCRDEMDRRKAEKEFYEKADIQRRLKIQQEKEEIKRLKRIRRNAELEKRVKKYKDASDTMLAVDSLIDVGKLGVSTIGGVLSTTARALYDPKVALERMKCKKTTPETAFQQFEKRYMESDAAATARRLKMRCLFMKTVKETRQKLEDNPITHFILHAADRDAKTRKFKRKPVKRRREPLDFECSLYMASLRKRPCLSIYYKWPWFYPHFVTMLNIWKQFTDVMLFLLAAVVWSPCILCMEGCRAMMCCVFCTG